MDETLRVKIVAETSQATSSMKQLNKETNALGSGTNVAAAAADKLDKTLNSVGFKSIRIKAIADVFKEVKASTAGIGASLKKTMTLTESWGKSFKASLHYIDHIGKKAPQAMEKIFAAQRALREARVATKDSDAVLNTSGLRKVREAVEALATSRNKYIKQTFNEADFEGLKNGLLKASRAAAKGAREDYVKSLKDMGKVISNSLEKETFAGSISNVFEKIKHGVSNTVKIVKSAIATIGKAIAATGIVALIVGAITAIKNAFNVSELGDQIDKTSQKVGMSTDAFQKWSYVLERCGIEASQLQTAMRALTRSSMGSNADYFRQLGINPEGMSQQQLFDSTVKALQNITDSTQRARMAYKLFGQSSAELAPLLAISSQEVERLRYQYDLLGATMSGKVVRASADMRDAITDLRAAWQGLKNTLAQAIIPIITKVIIRITVLVAKINMILQALFGVELEYNEVVESTQAVYQNSEDTVTAVKKLKTLISGFDELNIFPSQDNGADLGSFLEELGDMGSDVTPIIGDILPPEAIAELEDFRDNILPGIIEKFDELKRKWEEIKEVFADIEYALSGQKWQDAFDAGEIGDLSFWDMLLDLIGQISRGLEELMIGDGIKGLFEEWFPVGGELPEEGWFEEWIDRVFHGTEEEIGLFEMPGIKELVDFCDWFNETFYNGEGPFGKMPESWDEMFSFEGMFGTFDWESSGLYKFGEWIGSWNVWEQIGDWDIWKSSWWDELWQKFLHNVDPAYWWGGNDGEVIGLKEMLGFDKVEQWDIWKGSWWSEKWENVTKPIKEWWDGIKQWWSQNISPIFTKEHWTGKFQTLSIGLDGANIAAHLATVWVGIVQWFQQNVAPKFTKEYWQTKWASIKEGWNNTAVGQAIQNGWNGIKQWFSQSVAKFFTKAFWQQKWQSIIQGFKELSIIKQFSVFWTGIKLWWATSIAPKFTRAYWQEKWNKIKEGLSYSSILTGIQEKWKSVKTWWQENISPKFTWTYWKERWNNIVDTLASIDLANGAKKMMNGFLQAIEDGINKAIDSINNSGIAQFLGISLGHVWIPKFQTYAQGGVIDRPTAGIMGEYPGANSNPEIVTPENKMREVFETSNEDIVSVLIQGFRQIVQAIDEKDTTVQIGDTTIAKSAARGNRQYRLQTGQSLF